MIAENDFKENIDNILSGGNIEGKKIKQLDMSINDWLIPMHNIKTYKDIKSTFMDLIFEDIDLYSAVSYDESDKEIIDEFESIFSNKDINI